MDYFGIIKKAYRITTKNRFLWIFGILMAGAGGATAFNPGFNIPGSPDSTTLNQTLTSTQFTQKIADFWAQFGQMVIFGGLVLLLICMIFFILSIISQGALIGAVDKIDKGEKADFKVGFRLGAKNFWRVWGVAIVYLMLVLASLCVLVIPTSLLVIAGSYALAIGWGILAFFVCLFFWILVALIAPYSTIVVVLEKLSVWDSIRESLHLFRHKWPAIIIMYLLLTAIGIAYGIALMLAFLIIGGVAFAIGMAFWLASMWAAIIYGFSLGLILIVALVIINGAYKSFGSAVIVLTYNQLRK